MVVEPRRKLRRNCSQEYSERRTCTETCTRLGIVHGAVMPWPAAGTLLDFLSNFSDMEPSFLVHPCLSGFMFGELRSREYIANCMGAIAVFSMKDSFVDGRL